jgi:hypothetical protein
MSAGFYKRRRGILEHLESGKIGLLDLAIHDYLNLNANLLIGSDCSVPPGVCFSSAVAIHALCPREVSERTIRRSLAHLEHIGWIKRWQDCGKRGNYPILVCRASVHDMSAVEYRVNGVETTDWRNPVLTLAAHRPHSGPMLSGYREKRIENREQKNPAAKPVPPVDPRFQPFLDFAFRAFQQKHGQKPTWTGKDFKALSAMLASNKSLSADELERRFRNYINSTEPFTQKQGDSLAYFCAHTDSFLTGPILAIPGKGTPNGKDLNSAVETTMRGFAANAGIN